MELCVSVKNQVLFDARDLPYKPHKSAGELLGIWCILGPDLTTAYQLQRKGLDMKVV